MKKWSGGLGVAAGEAARTRDRIAATTGSTTAGRGPSAARQTMVRGHEDVGHVVDDVVEAGAVDERRAAGDVDSPREEAVGGIDERGHRQPEQRHA